MFPVKFQQNLFNDLFNGCRGQVQNVSVNEKLMQASLLIDKKQLGLG